MNWMSCPAQITCLIFVTILCLNDAVNYNKYNVVRLRYSRFEFRVPGQVTRTGTWKADIISRWGQKYYVVTVLTRNGIPTISTRRFRYPLSVAEGDRGHFIILNLTMDDGGAYYSNLTDHSYPYKYIELNLLVIEVNWCNLTEDHTLTVGDNLTYACSVQFWGAVIKIMAMWSGPGLTSQHIANYSREFNSRWKGVFICMTTLLVTPNLDGTTRTLTIKNVTETSDYVYRTGVLTVKCAGYLWGPACDKDPISCNDVTCQNGAGCQDNETTGFFLCQCAASYVGTYCELEIVSDSTVSTTETVAKDATPMTTGLSDEALVPFLSVLLLPPIGGVAVGGIILCRRRFGTEEEEEGSEGSSGWIEDDLSSPSQAS